MSEPEPLDYKGVSALTGLKVATLRHYKAHGRMPAPDALPAPDRPRWFESTIKAWLADPQQRPGRGAPGRLRKTRARA
jgi:predicted DNA-binding transcriptional regulator AlpA